LMLYLSTESYELFCQSKFKMADGRHIEIIGNLHECRISP